MLNTTDTQPEPPGAHPEPAETARPAAPRPAGKYFWQGKILPAFWTIASVISLTVNILLIVVLLLVGRQLFAIKQVSSDLIGGLHQNFIKMDAAHIVTNITVQDTIRVQDRIPVVFDLPLNQITTVRLVEDTPVNRAIVILNGQRVPTNIILRKGTDLKIKLDLTVPVSQTVPVVLNVPVNLNVPVDIPLEQTELHEPFVGLQDVVKPYDILLSNLPHSWEETPVCTPWLGWLCDWLAGETN